MDIYGEAVINGGRLNMNDLNFIGVSTPIVSLSMGTMKNLLYIHIENQQLEELDVSSCPALNSLTANNNHLTSVDFSNNLNMNNADLSYNQLTTIDFSMTNPTSTGFSLEATDNKLTSLYLPNDDGTTYDYNTSITISNNPNLTDIYTKKMKAKINFLKNTDGQVLKPSYTIHTKPGSTTVGSGTVDGTTPISFTYDRT
ncbi:hypothetical protein FACS1894166_09730 [Bacilli bacterium]|nr:hypothetical protein FACS1894166_09730 [Bacilli bacterium]